MKKLVIATLALVALALPSAGLAVSTGLQVNPLQYEDSLTAGKVKQGYIDVANPGDTAISVQSQVQGFRQEGADGRLEFFNDPQLSKGITVGLPQFELGPREALRVAFSVDPAKLPKGGVYAVIFFRTVPPSQTSHDSYVAESAKIGTLLLLQNGPVGAHVGKISQLSLPFWQFGDAISGQLTYLNTDRSAAPAAFRPSLTARVLPWGTKSAVATGLVLPMTSRDFALRQPGDYFGFLPVTIIDNDTHFNSSAWVFALTGWYRWAVPSLLVLAIAIFWAWRKLYRH